MTEMGGPQLQHFLRCARTQKITMSALGSVEPIAALPLNGNVREMNSAEPGPLRPLSCLSKV